jgi:hypothetical protein
MRKSAILIIVAAAMIAFQSSPATAAHWGKVKLDHCMGHRNCFGFHSAILWDIAPDVDWKYACEHTPHPKYGLPYKCEIGVNAWGKWKVNPDPECGQWCEGLRKN